MSDPSHRPGMFAGTRVPQGPHSAPENIRQDFIRLYEQWADVWDASGQRTTARIDQILHPEWTYTDTLGRLHDKEYYLGLVMNYDGTDTDRLKTLDVRLFGEVAIVNGTYEWMCREPGREEFRHDCRFTAVWVREESGWKAVAHQSTVEMGGVTY